jgi:pimeloyl-ACP methyl ester carboxylesterase
MAVALADGVRITRREVWVDGRLVRYKEAGAGEPVVLVHGLSGSTHWWSRNVAPLARQYRVLVVDLPGFGAMCRSRMRRDLDDAARWLLRWAESLGLRRADFIGHSMGGYICLRLATLRPYLVHRLVLTAPAVIAHGRTLAHHVLPLVNTARAASPRFLATLTYDAVRAGPVTLLRSSQAIINGNLRRDDLGKVDAPTLLLWGERDQLVPPSTGTALRRYMPNARLHIVKHGGHVPMFDQAGEFNATVLAFLGGETVGD